jgi:hypothetical protein
LATTPGCGSTAMSGLSLALSLVMISLSMPVTRCHFTVMSASLAFAASDFSMPSTIGWSMLVQIVTVSSPPPPPLPLPPLPPPRHPLTSRPMAVIETASPAFRIRCISAPKSPFGARVTRV